METRPAHIAVIGGGIAGLAAAYRLQQIAPSIRVTLVEKNTTPGGKLRTAHVDGYTIEAGPDSFLSTKPQAVALVREMGLENRLQGVNAATRRTFVVRDGRLYDLPAGLSGLVPGRLAPLFRSALLSIPGKARVAAEYMIPRGPREDVTLGRFMRRRMGNEVYERLIEPLMAGIYGGNGDELSLSATFPQLAQMEREHGSLLRAIGARKNAAGRSASPFLTPIAGTAEIVTALAERLAADIRLGNGAQSLERRGDGWRVHLDSGETIDAGTVIIATPAYAAADLLRPIDTALSDALSAIPYASSATLSLGYEESALPGPLRGHGYIVPRREGTPVLACTWSSSKFENRAPPGKALIRVFFGRAGQEEVLQQPDEALAELARAELRARMRITAEPELIRLFRWPRAMPQYTLGHLDRVATIENRVAHLPSLALAGAAYRGVGIPDVIGSGEAAARHVTTTENTARSPATI